MNNLPNREHSNLNSELENENNLNANVKTVAPKTVSYRDGYIHGRVSERSLENQRQQVRDENTAARGLLLGILLTSVAGLVAGTVFFLNQKEESPTPVIVPSRTVSPKPVKETTIIERTTENTRQLPPTTQEPPAVPQQNQPAIRVNTPTPQQQEAPTQQDTTPTPQQQAPTQQDTTPPSATSSERNQTSSSTPNIIQQDTTPARVPASSQNQSSTTTQPTTTNPLSLTQPQNQAPTDTSSTTTQPNTTTQNSSPQTQNQSQTDSSGSTR